MNVRHASKARQLMQGESRVTGQQGIALLTVMLMLLILSILGIASITVTSMENRMAGFFRTTEAVVAAADSCEGLAANLIQQTLSPLACCRPRLSHRQGLFRQPMRRFSGRRSLVPRRFHHRRPPERWLKTMQIPRQRTRILS